MAIIIIGEAVGGRTVCNRDEIYLDGGNERRLWRCINEALSGARGERYFAAAAAG